MLTNIQTPEDLLKFFLEDYWKDDFIEYPELSKPLLKQAFEEGLDGKYFSMEQVPLELVDYYDRINDVGFDVFDLGLEDTVKMLKSTLDLEDDLDVIDIDNDPIEDMVGLLEECENEVECKECFDLVKKESCTKTSKGYVCEKCSNADKRRMKLNSAYDYFDQDFDKDEEDTADKVDARVEHNKVSTADVVKAIKAAIADWGTSTVSEDFVGAEKDAYERAKAIADETGIPQAYGYDDIDGNFHEIEFIDVDDPEEVAKDAEVTYEDFKEIRIAYPDNDGGYLTESTLQEGPFSKLRKKIADKKAEAEVNKARTNNTSAEHDSVLDRFFYKGYILSVTRYVNGSKKSLPWPGAADAKGAVAKTGPKYPYYSIADAMKAAKSISNGFANSSQYAVDINAAQLTEDDVKKLGFDDIDGQLEDFLQYDTRKNSVAGPLVASIEKGAIDYDNTKKLSATLSSIMSTAGLDALNRLGHGEINWSGDSTAKKPEEKEPEPDVELEKTSEKPVDSTAKSSAESEKASQETEDTASTADSLSAKKDYKWIMDHNAKIVSALKAAGYPVDDLRKPRRDGNGATLATTKLKNLRKALFGESLNDSLKESVDHIDFD